MSFQKRIIALLYIVLFTMLTPFCVAQDDYVGQLIQVDADFNDIQQNATLWLQVQDTDKGAIRPFMLPLTEKYQHAIFSTQAMNFKIKHIWLQYANGHTTQPCEYTTENLSKQSIAIHLRGALGERTDELQCELSYYYALPINRVPVKEETQIVTAAKELTEDQRYYTNLATCTPGAYRIVYGDPYAKRVLPVLATISGVSNTLCQVTMEAGYTDPVDGDIALSTQCTFSQVTQQSLTEQAIDELTKSAELYDPRKRNLYQKSVCQECVSTLNGKKVQC